MFLRSLLWCSKALAITALFLTFPSIFRLAKNQALLVSFALTLFYFCKGLLSLLVDSSPSMHPRYKRWQDSVSAMELPLFLAVIYGSTLLIPGWMAKPYEWFLICTSPIFTIIEGLCVSLVIYCVGKYFMYYAREFNLFFKLTILSLFILTFLASSSIIVNIYLSNIIGPVTATFIGSTLTLALLLLALTLVKEEGTVIDGLLLYVYVVYNIWIISKTFLRTASKFYISNYALEFSSILSWLVPNTAVFSGFTAFLRLFSIDVAFGILFRITVFVLAAKFLEKIHSQEMEESSFDDDVTYNDLLLAFGKCILVMVYTYAWLQETDITIGSTSYIWRWINIYVTLASYMKNLFIGIDFELG